MATYKTKDGTLTGFVPGVGEIVDGKIEVPDGLTFENTNFELTEETTPAPPQTTQSQPQTAPAAPAASPAPVSTPQTAPALTDNQVNKETE